MTASKERLVRIGFLLLSCAVLIVCSLLILNQKGAYHLDEYASYSYANEAGRRSIRFENGTAYTAEEIRLMEEETFGVRENERFSFGTVWSNVRENGLSPVFYFLLHIVCSLTPGVFSMGQAAAANILLGLISLLFIRKFARAFFRSEWLAGLLCICWAGTMGLYSILIFFQEYAAGMCGVLIAAWESFRMLRGHRSVPDLIKTVLSFIFCVLCCYNCVFYILFLGAVLCVILLIRREWKDALKAAGVLAVSAAAAVLVIPAETFQHSLAAPDTLVHRASVYLVNTLSQSWFGSMPAYMGIFLLPLVFYFLLFRRNRERLAAEKTGSDLKAADLCLLLLPAACYAVLMCVIMPTNSFKYLHPVASVLYLSLVAVLACLGNYLLKPKVLRIVLAGLMVFMCCVSWPMGKVNFLYSNAEQKLEEGLGSHRGTEAAVIWNSGRSYSNVILPQAEYYGTMSFYHQAKEKVLQEIPALQEGRDMMILLGKDLKQKNYEETLLAYYPGYTADKIGNLDSQERFYLYWFHQE